MKKIVALLTGRGNNTLKDKNVLPVLGKPLLYYPAMAAKTCSLITDFYVSSDDEKILAEAEKLGPFTNSEASRLKSWSVS